MCKTAFWSSLSLLLLLLSTHAISGETRTRRDGYKIVLHKDLKVTGKPLRTYSHLEGIQYAMGHAEGYPISDKRLIRAYFNPFILMLHVGFATHRPVTISPDVIWLLICNGFSIHANLEGDALQKKLFPGAGSKIRLSVRRDNFVKGKNNPWEGVFDEFTGQMEARMANDVKKTLTAPFSTTGKTEQAAFNVTFMKTMSKSFEYYVRTFCGIPSITLEGSPEDWDAVAERAKALRGYGCDWWLDQLEPILKQFMSASRGNIDRKFWCSIYKVNEESGGSRCSGWCLNFFPYYQDGEKWVSRKKQSPIRPSNLPVTLAWVPFKWVIGPEDKGTTYDMAFQAGFVGVSLDSANDTLRTEISWSVVEKKKKRRTKVKNAALDMYRDLNIGL